MRNLRYALRYGIAGLLIPLLLWAVVKARDYAVITDAPGDFLDEWAFQLLIMFAPPFYFALAVLQDLSLPLAYSIALCANFILYIFVGAAMAYSVRFRSRYVVVVGAILAVMFVLTDNWYVVRMITGDEGGFSQPGHRMSLRYFSVAAVLVVALALISRQRTPRS
jgi:hypothetical protein